MKVNDTDPEMGTPCNNQDFQIEEDIQLTKASL